MRAGRWRVIPLIFFSLLIIFFWRGLSLDPHHLPSAQMGKRLPLFRMPMLQKHHEDLTPSLIHGHLSLLNVWASWCDACTSEQHFLMQLKHEGFIIYGLNYKDKPEHARHWLAEWGNPYRYVGQDPTGKVAIDLGVYGVPETFLIDKHGIIRHRHVGVLDAHSWGTEFLPLIRELEHAK